MAPKGQILNLTPAEVKSRARKYFFELESQGKAPWPSKFFKEKGFTRLECEHCKKRFWSMDKDRKNCGDSECTGGYRFLNPENPPQEKLTYLKAWEGYRDSFRSASPPHTDVPRYPVVARWRSDVDFVAAGIYCFQPFCVTGESEPPANPLIQSQFCLRFNDLDNIGVTGRHYSGFNMLGIQAFNRQDNMRDSADEFGDKEILWKDATIKNNFRWCTETLKLDEKEITFIEDVWQGGGNCGACIEYFYKGLEIGNMVFTEYAVQQIPNKQTNTMDCVFTTIPTKVVDVGIGLERIPWLVNGGWTSYIYVFDYCIDKIAKKLGVETDSEDFRRFAPYTALFDVDENSAIEETWKRIATEMKYDENNFNTFRQRLQEFSDLVIILDHTRTALYAIEDGSLPSNNGGAGNIRSVLRRAFAIIEKRQWLEKLGGVEGINEIFHMHMEGLKELAGEFKVCARINKETGKYFIDAVIELEYNKYATSRGKSAEILKGALKSLKSAELNVDEWIRLIQTHGVTSEDIVSGLNTKFPGANVHIPENLWIKFEEFKCRTAKLLAGDPYDVSGCERTEEIYNLPEFEYVYECKAKIVKQIAPNVIACDKSILYPTGGGQQHDDGWVIIDGKEIEVEDIVKVRNVVVIVLKEKVANVEGKDIVQRVNEDVRETLRVQHSATHVVAAAARSVLGDHVWQNGAKKTKDMAHIDLTHYELPSKEQMYEINQRANEFIIKNAHVTKKVYTRQQAEKNWGFTLYQGGAIPGNDIRVVDICGIDTEACCGTHVNELREIGCIRILSHNSVQDGVFRINFVAGRNAYKQMNHDIKLLDDSCRVFSCNPGDLLGNCERFFKERNQNETKVKNLNDKLITYEVKFAGTLEAKGVIINKTDTNGSGFIRFVQEKVSKTPTVAQKNIILCGPTYLMGVINQEDQDDIVKIVDNTEDPKESSKQDAKKVNTVTKKFEKRIFIQNMNISTNRLNAIKQKLMSEKGFENLA